ncbi:MAG: hypothetical protein COU71_00605 [Parcubacteria group bacterium CG10_big_fil_rev_8_21_14_0_10_38_31]|nr:MAG: hypothetical protein COU71_00605 [Parcubacteria group bacterium CG10_big_fil_rev_8_21_14_0_10_38_31]
MWKTLSPFLEKFKNLKVPKEALIDDLIEIILNTTGIKLEKENISVNKPTIFIKANSMIKSEIFFKKQQILEELEKQFYSKSITDIR